VVLQNRQRDAAGGYVEAEGQVPRMPTQIAGGQGEKSGRDTQSHAAPWTRRN